MKMFSLFALVALVMSMSACTLFGGVTNKFEAQADGTTKTTTVLYDYWNGEVVLEGSCKTHDTFNIPGGNGVTDHTYKGCTIK